MRPFHIIAAVDGSEASDRALDWAASLAQCNDVPLTVAHVMTRGGSHRVPMGTEEYQLLENIRLSEHDVLQSAADGIVARAALRARDAGASKVDTTVLVGEPAKALAAAADDLGANLVVVGCRGLSNVPGMMLGSVSHRLLHVMERGAVLAVH